MSILSAFKYLVTHKPEAKTVTAIEQVVTATQALLDALKAQVPDVEGKAEAIAAVEAAAAHANLAFTKAHAIEATDAATAPQT